jgi:hypothetical protein
MLTTSPQRMINNSKSRNTGRRSQFGNNKETFVACVPYFDPKTEEPESVVLQRRHVWHSKPWGL